MEKPSYDQWAPKEIDEVLRNHAQYAPADSVCPVCTRFLPNHPGLEQILAIRRLKYLDPDINRMVTPQGGIPYCNCREPRTTEEPRPRYAE